MKGVPAAEQEKILALVEKNPEFFKKIATEIQQKMNAGKDQMAATFEVMRTHQAELKNII